MGMPSQFRMTTPSTPLWDCILFNVSSISDYKGEERREENEKKDKGREGEERSRKREVRVGR